MSTRTPNYIEAVEHLPDDAVLILNGVTWEEYEHLLVDIENWPGKRVTYYKGRLEVVSPSPKHEKIKIFIDHLVAAFCDHRNIPMEDLGSTTFKSKRDDQGAEPDVCFYVAGLEGIIGKDEIDRTMTLFPTLPSRSTSRIHPRRNLKSTEASAFPKYGATMGKECASISAPVTNMRRLPPARFSWISVQPFSQNSST